MRIPQFGQFAWLTLNIGNTHKLEKVFHSLFQLLDALAHFNIIIVDPILYHFFAALTIVRMAIFFSERLGRLYLASQHASNLSQILGIFR